MKEVVDPLVRDTERALRRAEADYEAMREAFPRLGDYDPATGAKLVAGQHFDALQRTHRRRFEKAMGRWLGVDVTPMLRSESVRPIMEAAIKANVALIKTIPPRYHDGLGKRMEKHLFGGQAFDEHALTTMLTAEYKSTGYNVRRLARDQTTKTVGKLNGHRQTAVGVEEYEWQTSGDHRVRESHVELNGTLQRWGRDTLRRPSG